MFGFDFFQVFSLEFFGGAGRLYSTQGIVRVWFRQQGSGAKIIWEYDSAGGTACPSSARPRRIRSSTTCWTWYETEIGRRQLPQHPLTLTPFPFPKLSLPPNLHLHTYHSPSMPQASKTRMSRHQRSREGVDNSRVGKSRFV